MSRFWGIALTLAVLAIAACGRPSHVSPAQPRDVLTRDDIERTHAVNAFDAVQRLRSNWLQKKGSTQMPANASGQTFQEPEIQVYLDDQRVGTIEQLQNIESAAVEYIRFIQPAEAASRYGFGHGAGVIYVSTRPQ